MVTSIPKYNKNIKKGITGRNFFYRHTGSWALKHNGSHHSTQSHETAGEKNNFNVWFFSAMTRRYGVSDEDKWRENTDMHISIAPLRLLLRM